jgi:glucokinase
LDTLDARISTQDKTQNLAIGLDVGATKIAAALVTASGQILATRQAPTHPKAGPAHVLDRIAALIDELVVLSVNTRAIEPMGVGIGIPGQIDQGQGLVRGAVNLGWDEVYLVRELSQRLGKPPPIWVETDANAATLGEYYFGAGRGCQDLVYLSIGSGLGAGVICHGKLVTGVTGKAAEMGHFSLDVDGLPCVCGLNGCAETLVSGPGLIKLAIGLLEKGELPSRLNRQEELDPSRIVTAAIEGDLLAREALSEMGRHLGTVMAICAAVLNPALIVVGGGLGLAAFDLLVPSSWREIERRILPSTYVGLKILASQQASSAAGAASLALFDACPSVRPA